MQPRESTPSRAGLLLRAGGLAPLLVLSAALIAVSQSSPEWAWIGWICLTPLMAAARILPPVVAGLAGAAWGLFFYATASALPTPILAPGLTSLVILALVPGGFCLLASLATRALGFAPIILALIWMLAEAVVAPMGLRGGLLVGAQVDTGWSAWIVHLLGYVFVAFTVVYANASLLALLGHMSVRLPTAAAVAFVDAFSILFVQQTGQSSSVTVFRSHPARASPYLV